MSVVHLIGCWILEGLVVSVLIIMPEVEIERLFQPLSVLEGGEVDALVLHAAPEPFHNDVFIVAALAFRVDLDAALLQYRCKSGAGELGALNGIEDLWRPVAL